MNGDMVKYFRWRLVPAILLVVFTGGYGFAAVTLSPASKQVSATTTKAAVTVKFSGEPGTSAILDVQVTAPEGMVTGVTGNGSSVTLKKGKGVGKVAFQLGKNPSSVSRTALATINGQPFELTQSGAPCTASLTSVMPAFDYFGGDGVITVTAPEGCQWQATSSPWITLSAMSGNGSGTIPFQVASNGSKKRSGSVSVILSGGKKTVTIAQKNRTFAPDVKVSTPTPVTKPTDAAKSYLIGRRAFSQIADLMTAVGDPPVPFSPVRAALPLSSKLSPRQTERLLLPLGLAVKRSRVPIEPEQCEGGGQITGTTNGKGKGTLRFEQCRQGDSLLEGSLSINAKLTRTGGMTGSFSLGSAAQPFTVTTYREGVFDSTMTAVVSGKLASSDIIALSDLSITVNGFTDLTEQERRTLLDMKSFSLTLNGADISNMSLGISGSLRTTIFQANEFLSSQELKLANFQVAVVPVDTVNVSVSIDGLFAIESIPLDSCLDGTFDMNTTSPLILPIGGNAFSGTVVINGATIAPNDTGGVTVTINGATTAVTAAEMDTLCPL